MRWAVLCTSARRSGCWGCTHEALDFEEVGVGRAGNEERLNMDSAIRTRGMLRNVPKWSGSIEDKCSAATP